MCADVLDRFRDRLKNLSAELKSCSKRPGESLVKAARIFVEAVQRHVEGEMAGEASCWNVLLLWQLSPRAVVMKEPLAS